jgi:hypothetical protein
MRGPKRLSITGHRHPRVELAPGGGPVEKAISVIAAPLLAATRTAMMGAGGVCEEGQVYIGAVSSQMAIQIDPRIENFLISVQRPIV